MPRLPQPQSKQNLQDVIAIQGRLAWWLLLPIMALRGSFQVISAVTSVMHILSIAHLRPQFQGIKSKATLFLLEVIIWGEITIFNRFFSQGERNKQIIFFYCCTSEVQRSGLSHSTCNLDAIVGAVTLVSFSQSKSVLLG